MKPQGELEKVRKALASTRNVAATGPAALLAMGIPTLSALRTVDVRYRSSANAARTSNTSLRYLSGKLEPWEILEHHGITHVRAIRALFDTYRLYGRREALVPLEWLRFHHQVSTEHLLRQAETLPAANGIRAFRGLIGDSAATSQSPLETIGRDVILQAELPEIETIEFQVRFDYAGTHGEHRVALVDVLINRFLAIELDGNIKYDGSYGAPHSVMMAELQRQKELQALGLVVLRAGWADVTEGKLVRDITRLVRAFPKVAGD